MANIVLIAIGFAAGFGMWLALKSDGLASVHAGDGVHEGVSGNLLERLVERSVGFLNRSALMLPPKFLGESWFMGVAKEFSYTSLLRGHHLEPGASLLLVCVLICASGLLGLIVAQSLIGFCAGVVVGAAFLFWCAGSHERKRAQKLAAQVPDIYRSLSGALSSGRTLAQAIAYVGSGEQGPLQREFGRASLMVSCGVSAVDALRELPLRVQAPGIDLMVTALSVSARTGAPLQELFARSARMVERRFELERELSAKTAQVRLSARLVGAMPVGMVCFLALLSPDFREGLTTPLGSGCVAVAIILDVVALVIIRRLMKGVV